MQQLKDFNLFNKMGRSWIREGKLYVRKSEKVADSEKRRYSSLKRFSMQEMLLFSDILLITKHWSQSGKYHVSDLIELGSCVLDESAQVAEEDIAASSSSLPG